MGFGPKAGTWASRLEFGSEGWDLGLKDGIWALVIEFEPQGWDLGLETGIWASKSDLLLDSIKKPHF